MKKRESSESAVTVRGLIETMYFSKDGFAAGLLRLADDSTVKFAGPIYAHENDPVVLCGRWHNHPKYGRQFKVTGVGGCLASYCPSAGPDQLSFCVSLAHTTSSLMFGTSIHPIYFRQAWDVAQTATYIDEVSAAVSDRGLGVSHGPIHERLNLETGRPLSDMRRYVADLARRRSGVGASLRSRWPPFATGSAARFGGRGRRGGGMGQRSPQPHGQSGGPDS